jgi:hypothetical protein
MVLYKNDMRPFWICATTTLLNSIISAGFSIAAVVQQKGNILSLYAASRSISLLLVILGAVFFRSKTALAAMAITMAIVQSFDAVIGMIAHDTSKTIGPLILALATFASVSAMLRKAGVADQL